MCIFTISHRFSKVGLRDQHLRVDGTSLSFTFQNGDEFVFTANNKFRIINEVLLSTFFPAMEIPPYHSIITRYTVYSE